LKPTQTYPETHTDHITSFLPLPNINPHHVLCTSGDCTVSIFDLRKPKAVATSEDQEDEPLCSAFAGDSRPICVGTQAGFVTVWKSGEWMDHVDRIAPADRLRKSDEAPSVDCMVQLDEEVIVGTSDGIIRRLGFRPNRYGDVVGRCEDVVTCLSGIPDQDGWVVSGSGTSVKFWNIDAEENNAEDGKEDEDRDDDDDNNSSEEEKPKKRRKKSKKTKKANGDTSTFFAGL
jgi:WD repeat-containing protein 55